MIFKLFINSLKTSWNQRKMAVLLWSVTLLVALPSFWTIHRSLGSYFGGRAVASEWLHVFSLNYYFEMVSDLPTINTTFGAGIVVSMLLYVLVSFFLTGGVIGRLFHSAEDGFGEIFFKNGSAFFFRYLRTFLWTVLLSAVSLVFMMIGGFAGLLSAALTALWIITSDVTKIRLYVDNSRKVTKYYFSSLTWVLKNFLPVFGLYLMNFILLVMGFMLYKLLDNNMTPDSGFMIFLMLVWQQVYVYFRSVMKIQFLGSAILLWNERPIKVTLREEPVITPVENEPGEQVQPA